MTLGPSATSYTTMGSLLPGNDTFNINYTRDLSAIPPLTLTMPTNGGGPFADWSGVQGVRVSIADRVSFTVAPEPGTAALLAFATGALFADRRRRAA